MKTLVIAIAMMGIGAGYAEGTPYAIQPGESTSAYESRIYQQQRVMEAAQKTIDKRRLMLEQESRTYIDSNMLWADNEEFQGK